LFKRGYLSLTRMGRCPASISVNQTMNIMAADTWTIRRLSYLRRRSCEMVSQKEVFKQVRDRLVPFLLEEARQEMMGIYKPGVVEPLGDASVDITMSSKPLRSIRGPTLPLTEFYGLFKFYIPLRPTIDVKDQKDLLQEGADYHIHVEMGGETEKPLDKDRTLVMYSIDFWLTSKGEVWHEASSGLWRKVLQLLPAMLPDKFIKLTFSLRLDHVF